MTTPKKIRRRRIIAIIVGVVALAAGGIALADPAPLDQILLPVDHVVAGGIGPQSFQLNWHDGALIEQHFEIQEQRNPNAPDEQWNNVGTAPASPLNAVGTVRYASLTLSAIPQADPRIHYFRVRAVLDLQGQDLITGPWSSPDPAIAGPMPAKDVAAQNVAVGSIKVTWTNQATGDPMWSSTDVYRSIAGSGSVRIASLAPGVTSYTDTAVPPGTVVSYRLFAVRQTLIGGSIETSSSIGVPPVVTVNSLPRPRPTAPTNLMATLSHIDSTQDRVDLAWQDNATDEDGYFVEFSPEPTFTSSSTQQVSIPAADAHNYTQFVVPDTVRFYRVRAFRNVDGQVSLPSNTASIGAIPSTPTNLIPTRVTNAEVDLAWKDNSTTEDGFRVEWCSGLCNAQSVWNVLGYAGINDQQFADNTVTQLIRRSYRVFAFNGSGSSGSSNVLTVDTPKAPLAAPTGLSATGIDSRHIKLTWTPPNAGEDGYRIEYSGPPGGPWQVLNTVGAGISTYTDGFSLNPNTQRCYRIRSFQTTDTYSDASLPACAVTTPPQIPLAPTSLVVIGRTSTSIKLQWQDNAINEQGFKVERSNDGADWVLVATIYNVNLNTFNNTGLFPSHPYSYRVRAFNADGDSDPSNVATAATAGPPPPVWVSPNHDNEIAVSACNVTGTADVSANVTAVEVYVTDTKDNSTQFAGVAFVDPFSGKWKLGVRHTIQIAGTYHLSAFARVEPTPNNFIYSLPSRIHNWIVPADSLIC